MIHEDEASFRQDSTLHRSWSRCGSQPLVPVTGERKSFKVFGSVDIFSARFLYQSASVFNAQTYGTYLDEQLAPSYFPRKTILIQDNASYHKDKNIWAWFKKNRHWLTVYQLPPYCPELNAAERIWHHTRLTGTHNRYFVTVNELEQTVTQVFENIQHQPQSIKGYLAPFC